MVANFWSTFSLCGSNCGPTAATYETWVCVCVSVYNIYCTYIHIQLRTNRGNIRDQVCACVRACVRVCILYIYICIRLWTNRCKIRDLGVCLCVRACLRVYVYVCVCIYTYKHIYVYIFICPVPAVQQRDRKNFLKSFYTTHTHTHSLTHTNTVPVVEERVRNNI